MRLPKIVVWLALVVAWVCGHVLLWRDRHALQQVAPDRVTSDGALPVFK